MKEILLSQKNNETDSNSPGNHWNSRELFRNLHEYIPDKRTKKSPLIVVHDQGMRKK
jgi:hypothetical protein